MAELCSAYPTSGAMYHWAAALGGPGWAWFVAWISIAGSIASQLVKALAQAGFLEAWTSPVWDTSQLLAPDSALGTFLHALMGYDATPSGAQLASYLAVLALIYAGTKLMRRGHHAPSPRAS